MKNLRGWNEFGIAPTTNHAAAGYDFYVPYLDTVEKKAKALKAFEKSYKKTSEELEELMNKLKISVTSQWGHRFVEDNIENILMLYLSLDSNTLNDLGAINSDARISSFVNNYLLFDENLKPGIVPLFSDHLFICSGVHVCLESETAGIFYNKSGMGNRGWDTRACVVGEDYSGICHLSASYTKMNSAQGKFFCGDKFSQMVVEVIVRGDSFEDMGEEAYKEAMANSSRGDKSFGSSDVKH